MNYKMAVPKRKKCKSRACIRINLNKVKLKTLNKIKTNTIRNDITFFKFFKKSKLILL